MTNIEIEIQLEKKEFEKKKDKFQKAYANKYPGEMEEGYAIIDEDVQADEFDYEDGCITLLGEIADVGYAQFKIPLGNDVIASIIETQVKRYNKIKTMLETMK